MRITMSIDEDLLSNLRAITGFEDASEVAEAGLKALIEHESARRLACISGINPDFEIPPRKRSIE